MAEDVAAGSAQGSTVPPGPQAEADGSFAALVESLRGIVWRADAERSRYSYVSPHAETILCHPAGAWLARDFWREHIHPEDRERVEAESREAVRDGRGHDLEYRMTAADGREVWLRDAVTVSCDPGGAVRLSGIMLDVTAEKALSETLRASEERLALAQEAGRVGTFDWELRTDRAVFSRQAQALFGFPDGGLTPEAWFRVVHPDDVVDAVDAVQNAFETGALEADYRVAWPDGSVHWLRTRGRATGEDRPSRRMVGVVVDVTEEREAERERLRLLHSLQERVKEQSALHGAARLLLGSQTLPEDVLGRLAALLPPAFQYPEVTAARVRMGTREAATPGFDEDRPLLRAGFTAGDGTCGHVDVVYLADRPPEDEGPFLTEERSLLESVAEMLRIASAHQAAERALRESDERYRLVARATDDILYDLDLATGDVRVSDTLNGVWGYPPGTKPLAWWRTVIHPEDAGRVADALDAALAGGGDTWRADYRLRRHDGTYLNVLDRGHIVRAADGRAVRIVGAVMDVTERTQLEEQLRQSQKLEALGCLAAGVAHDFNNLLTVITGYSDFLVADRERDDPVRQDLEEIRSAAARASLLTQQLLAFGRKQARKPEVVDLHASVRELSTMLVRLLGEDVVLETALAAEGAAVLADPGQIQQVVINLAVNARDAMPAGGVLRIATRHARVDAAEARELGVGAGSYVVIEVRDTGVGMAPEVRERIFEPFFTTKEIGRGTGLGLATVYGIVEQSQGFLRVDSAEGRGTTVEVHLPRVGLVPAAAERPAPAAPPPGSATVLLVEDDEALRRVAIRILERAGYRVVAATDTADALRLSQRTGGAIDLLVTDVVMPGMSGPELAARVEAARPGVKVLFMSGYSGDAMGMLEEGVGFIQKPFAAAALAAKIREVLGDG